MLTVHANAVSGYTCETKTLTVEYADQPFTVSYKKNSTPEPSGKIYVKARDTDGNALSFDCYYIKKEVWEGYPYTAYAGQPSSDYEWLGWSYEASGSSVIDRETAHGLTQAQYEAYTTIYGVYEKKKITYKVSLSVSPDGSGSVSGSGNYEYGETATIIATPNAGYSFKKWSDENTSSNRSIFIDRNLNLTAYFELVTYSISWDLAGGTWVSQYPTTYNVTSNIKQFPTPEKAGYRFLGWYDNSTGTYVSSISPGTTGDKSFVAK